MKEKPSRAAILLSAVVSPGAGQFVQRRWVAGAIFLTAFLICAVFLLIEILRPMVTNILISIDFADRRVDAPFVKFGVIRILAWLGASLVVYFIGLLDTMAAYGRQCRQWAESRIRRNVE